MRSVPEIFADILARPEDDAVRLEYADACEASDPDRADYIRWHVSYAHWELTGAHPAGTPRRYRGTPGYLDQYDREAEWGLDLEPYLRSKGSKRFHRGFVIEIQLYPEQLIEHGDTISRLAPIRVVNLTQEKFDAPLIKPWVRLPMQELLAAPLTRQLHSINTWKVHFTMDDFRAVAASPHLESLRHLHFDATWYDQREVTAEVWDVLAASPVTRKLLAITGDLPHFPGEWVHHPPDPYLEGGVWQPVRDHGRALEARYGYIPWLHPTDNGGGGGKSRYQIGQLVARGTLPRYPPGTPVTEAMYEVPPPVRNDHYW